MKSNVIREKIDPNTYLKQDCASEWHDDIINLPSTFERQYKDFMKEVTKNNSKMLPVIPKHRRGNSVI